MSFAEGLLRISQDALRRSREEIVQAALKESLTDEESLLLAELTHEPVFSDCMDALKKVAELGATVAFGDFKFRDTDAGYVVTFNHRFKIFFTNEEVSSKVLFKAFRIHARNNLGITVEFQPHAGDKWKFSWEKNQQ